MLMADLRRDYVQTLFERLDDLAMSELEAQFKALEDEGRKALLDSGIALDRIAFERAADMRYVGQEHAVAVGMPAAVGDESARAEVKRRFDEAHDLRYSHSAPEESADIVSLRVSAIGRLNKPVFPQIAKRRGCAAGRGATRRAHRELRCRRRHVSAGVRSRPTTARQRHPGPAIIEEVASTTVVEPGDLVTVNEYGHLVMQLNSSL